MSEQSNEIIPAIGVHLLPSNSQHLPGKSMISACRRYRSAGLPKQELKRAKKIFILISLSWFSIVSAFFVFPTLFIPKNRLSATLSSFITEPDREAPGSSFQIRNAKFMDKFVNIIRNDKSEDCTSKSSLAAKCTPNFIVIYCNFCLLLLCKTNKEASIQA